MTHFSAPDPGVHMWKSEGQTLLQSDCPHLCQTHFSGNSLPPLHFHIRDKFHLEGFRDRKTDCSVKTQHNIWLAQEAAIVQTVSLFAWLLGFRAEAGLLFLNLGVGGGGWQGFLDIPNKLPNYHFMFLCCLPSLCQAALTGRTPFLVLAFWEADEL